MILSRPINRYTFVFYEEDSNTILTTALKNYLDRLISIEYENSKHTHQGRVQPDLQVLNNAISTGTKEKNDKTKNKISSCTTRKPSSKQGRIGNLDIQKALYSENFQNQPLVHPTTLVQDGGPRNNLLEHVAHIKIKPQDICLHKHVCIIL